METLDLFQYFGPELFDNCIKSFLTTFQHFIQKIFNKIKTKYV